MSKKSPNRDLAPFHQELLEILSRNSKELIEENNGDGDVFLKQLSENASDELLPLAQIIENYQHLFGAKGPAHIEKTLLESFPANEFIELGLTRYYPRVYRGLPRLYLRGSPTESHIKKNFTHLPSLKKQALSKSLFSLYSKLAAVGKVTLFNWVMKDGMGDFVAATEVMRLLRSRLAELDLVLISFVPEKAFKGMHFPENTIVIPYNEEVPFVTLDAFFRMAESDLIVQLPTFYPYTQALMEALPHVRWEMVGEYGFIESGWFHPKSGRYSLGLHFLEKGILTRKPCLASWDDVQNEKLKLWRCSENRFYLAYLTTPLGGAIYLHALLKSLENDPSNIDLCMPDLGWFIAFSERQEKMGRPFLEWDLGVCAIEIYFDDKFCKVPVSHQGKIVRILCTGPLSQSDFRALLSLSEEWVAIRGNQSFSEAVSQGKAFFYDGREHSRYFIKDFSAIAENRIQNYPGTLECTRGMVQGFLYNLSVQDDVWVDETYFQELEEWTSIALKMGLALQDPETISGFKRLNRIIADEFSANSFLMHLIQRALCHIQHPYVEQLESDNVERFIKNDISFKELIQTQKTILDSCQKSPRMG